VLEQATVHEQLAQQELERAKRLVNTQAISREELDARTSAVAEGRPRRAPRMPRCARRN
jgi:multidrug resistance efflux pump